MPDETPRYVLSRPGFVGDSIERVIESWLGSLPTFLSCDSVRSVWSVRCVRSTTTRWPRSSRRPTSRASGPRRPGCTAEEYSDTPSRDHTTPTPPPGREHQGPGSPVGLDEERPSSRDCERPRLSGVLQACLLPGSVLIVSATRRGLAQYRRLAEIALHVRPPVRYPASGFTMGPSSPLRGFATPRRRRSTRRTRSRGPHRPLRGFATLRNSFASRFEACPYGPYEGSHCNQAE